ncbi:hypothetical protein P9112_006382 [Eukaryota sp. TZLM1-RC]
MDSPLLMLTVRSSREYGTCWKTLLLSEASQLIPKHSHTFSSRKSSSSWSQVLSPDPSIFKPLSGDLSVSDLDTSPPTLLPSNAVDFDSLSMPKTSESTTKIRDSPSRCFPTITQNPSKRLLNPLSTSDPHTESSSINRIFSLSSVCANKSINCPKFIELWLQINNIEVSGLIDSGASISVISRDPSTKCKMEHSSESVKFIGVNGEPSKL